MNIDGHLKYGAITGATVTVLTYAGYTHSISSSIGLGLLTLIGSLIPDLDIHSTPSKWTARALSLLIIVTLLQHYAEDYFVGFNKSFVLTVCLVFTVIKSSKHRGFTHKYTVPIIFASLAYYFKEPMFSCFGVGLLCHYACDSMKLWDYKNWI